MNKIVKIILGACAAVVLLSFAAILLITVVVDPNEYKDEIVQLVREKTERKLTFEGDIELNFYPYIGFKIGAVALGNAPGFPDLDMARINNAEVSLRLIPLLSGKVAVGKVILDGLSLHLVKNSQGIANWDDMAGDSKEVETASADLPFDSENGSSVLNFEDISVQGIEITDANLLYTDLQNDSKTSIGNLNLKLGAIQGNSSFPFELGFEFKLDQPSMTLQPHLTGNIQLNPAAKTVAFDNLALSVLDLRLTGQVHAEAQSVPPTFSGSMQLAETSLRELITKFGAKIPEMSDSDALKRFSAEMQFDGTDNSAELKSLTVKLDDSTLTAEAKVVNYAAPQISINAMVDAFDADRYLPSQAKSESENKPEQETAAPDSAQPVKEPNLDALRNLILDARLKIGSFKVQKVQATDILIDVDAHDGVLAVNPSFNLYDGQFEAQTRLDANGEIPRWSGSGKLQKLDTRSLLHDLLGKDLISGTALVEYNLSGSGLTPDGVKKTVSGTAAFAVTEGAVLGVDVAKMIRDSWNKIMGADEEGDETGNFNFSSLEASATLKNGHIINNDLLFDSQLVESTGAGWADLPDGRIDYKAMVTVVGSLDGLEGEILDTVKDIPLPLRVKGKLNDPSIGLDEDAMTKLLVTAGISLGLDTLADSLLGDMDKDDSHADEAGTDASDDYDDDSDDLFGDLF
ncbi:AsmA family protein [Maridesulfovibrio sp.]|uniref:AsmA family protein n=1 Tax=Maridesulfovibrio sp. TaxID=2795000 RepID=UPI0029C9D7F5|nr:AsmA family protein [Maridesulfovibrio sp.]